eukprot:Polyplicarium_translucidae@DN1812_c0_g1_i1.p1
MEGKFGWETVAAEAMQFLKEHEQREGFRRPPVHSVYKAEGVNEVLIEERVTGSDNEDRDEDDESTTKHRAAPSAYDVLMIKVDLRRAQSPENNFYHMQLIHERRKDLFVLLTRWGRVGETGMHQRTPFETKEEAVKAFSKIFLTKSGNEWKNRAQFEKKAKKYSILPFDRTKIGAKDALRKFSLKTCPASALPKCLQQTMAVITHRDALRDGMRSHSSDINQLPLSSLRRESLLQAQDLLAQIAQQRKRVDERRASPDYGEELHRHLELCSRFYSCVPRDDAEIGPAMMSDYAIDAESKRLEDLLQTEAATNIILAGLRNETKIHPYDYCMKALHASLEALDPLSDRFLFEMVAEYFKATVTGLTINNIYRLTREHEVSDEQTVRRFRELGDHRLLWHGTASGNVLGILSRGLRIAPSCARFTGSAFGQGVYFADAAGKSVGYSGADSSWFTKNRSPNAPRQMRYLFLCEVALGDRDTVRRTTAGPRPGYNSVEALGQQTPDWDKAAVALNDGCRVSPCVARRIVVAVSNRACQTARVR